VELLITLQSRQNGTADYYRFEKLFSGTIDLHYRLTANANSVLIMELPPYVEVICMRRYTTSPPKLCQLAAWIVAGTYAAAGRVVSSRSAELEQCYMRSLDRNEGRRNAPMRYSFIRSGLLRLYTTGELVEVIRAAVGERTKSN